MFGEFLDYLRTCQLLEKDSAPWSWFVDLCFADSVCCKSKLAAEFTVLINNCV